MVLTFLQKKKIIVRKPQKSYFRRAFTRDCRGEAVVVNDSLSLDTLQLGKLNVDKVRKIPEEQICSVLGIPAVVVGFGTGLDQTKVSATMAELREQAFENAAVPLMNLQEEYTVKLVSEYDTTGTQKVVRDLLNMRVLQEDLDKLNNTCGVPMEN